MSTAEKQGRRGPLSMVSPAMRVISLLIGLPIMLQLMLWLTESRFGLWPSLVATTVVGVSLSIVYTADRKSDKVADADSVNA